MALEYVARIYKGSDNAVSCVRAYSKAFLVDINPRYGDVCGILWRTARNGMVHGSWPLRVSLEGETAGIRLSVGNETTDPHLILRPDIEGDLLEVSAPRFLDDLETSISNGFADWVRKSDDRGVLERGQPRLLVISKDDHEARTDLRKIRSWERSEAASG